MKDHIGSASMSDEPTSVPQDALNCVSLSGEQAALPRLQRYLYGPSAALQETPIRDRPLINIDIYTIYCGNAGEKSRKLRNSNEKRRQQSGGEVWINVAKMRLCTIGGSQRTQTPDRKCSRTNGNAEDYN
ncbi:hypothetical protein RB195_020549 [Necator americanus]|uniref:Uncharacterized protein n=1 Tax=Necator americanus TaxID=51031 RepID=A0ABR1CKS6_NECAM